MQSKAPRGQQRMAVVTMRVVTVDGEPVTWAKPDVTMIESAMAPAELLALLGAKSVDIVEQM